MRWLSIILATFALALGATSLAHAGSDGTCQCRANGSNYDLATVVCIHSGSLSFLARCEMVLNNTAWKKLADSCPYSRNDAHTGETLVASAADPIALCEPARWLGKASSASKPSQTQMTARLPASRQTIR